jgi:YD repeat-containing protein
MIRRRETSSPDDTASRLEKIMPLHKKLLLTTAVCVVAGALSALTATNAAATTPPCGLCGTETATLDGMGRLVRTQHPSVFGRVIEIDGSYDQLGRLSSETNPYFVGQPDWTAGSLQRQYDGLDRMTETLLPDGSATTVSYHGSCVVTSDEAGASRKSCEDALGRLIEVDEPGFNAGTASDPTGLLNPYVTKYFYGTDASGNTTTCIEQHGWVPSSSGCSSSPSADATSQWRVRRATYDSLGQLISVSNPETGTITYTYDVSGNVTSKTSPAPNQPATSTATVTVSYAYDQLNRAVGKYYGSVGGAPAVTYGYDSGPNAIGHQTLEATSGSSKTTSYDAFGHIIAQSETTNGITNTTRYTYHLTGAIASIQYPSGLALTYAHQSGRQSGLDRRSARQGLCQQFRLQRQQCPARRRDGNDGSAHLLL